PVSQLPCVAPGPSTRSPGGSWWSLLAHARAHRHEGLSSEFDCQFDGSVLGLYSFPETLSGGAPVAGCLEDQAGSSETHVEEEGIVRSGRSKERLQPVIGDCLEVTHQFQETQFSSLLQPHRGPQSGAEGIREDNQQQAPIQITERRLLGAGR